MNIIIIIIIIIVIIHSWSFSNSPLLFFGGALLFNFLFREKQKRPNLIRRLFISESHLLKIANNIIEEEEENTKFFSLS
jgi:hypothetical protein